MTQSALTDHGIDQELSGAALDVFSRTIQLDPGLLAFHEGRVKIGTVPMVPFEEVENWSVVTSSLGFENPTPKLGGAQEGVRLNALLFFSEPSWFRLPGEAGFADLDMLFRLAIQGGQDSDGVLVPDNEQLRWKSDPGWGPTPAGYKPAIDEVTARGGVIRGTLETTHDGAEASLSGMEPCYVHVLGFTAVFGVARSKC